MMYGDMVHAAGMDVELVPKILPGHGRTLNVPARVPHPPRALPLHDVFLGRLLPEGKIGVVFLLRISLNSCTGQLLLKSYTRKLTVSRKSGYVEVDAVACLVGISLLDKFHDHLKHLFNVLGGIAYNARTEYVETSRVPHKRLGVVTGDFPRRLFLPAGCHQHLVFAFIGVGHQVTDIGYVHDHLDRVAVVLKHPPENIRENVRPHVPYGGVLVDRRATRVHPDLTRHNR